MREELACKLQLSEARVQVGAVLCVVYCVVCCVCCAGPGGCRVPRVSANCDNSPYSGLVPEQAGKVEEEGTAQESSALLRSVT